MSNGGQFPRISDAEMAATPRPVMASAADYPTDAAVPAHAHIRAQLIHATAGVMRVTADEGLWVVPPERALWVPAGTDHAIAMRGSVQMRTLYIEPGAAPGLPDRCTVVAVGPLLRALILRAIELPVDYDEAGADGRVMAVLLDELRALPTIPLHLPKGRDRRLTRVTDALERRPGDPRALEDWARETGASARTLARLFLRETGLTFGAWRQQARLLEALIGLAEGRPVTALALDLGYASPSAFIQAFKRAFGTTPSRYFRERRESAAT